MQATCVNCFAIVAGGLHAISHQTTQKGRIWLLYPAPFLYWDKKMKLNASEFHLSFDYQSSFVSLVRRYVSPCIAVSVFLVKYKTTWKCPDIRFIGWE